MRWYADHPARRARQLTGDLFVLGWVLAWVLVGRWVFGLVQSLAGPADPLREAGTSMDARMTDIAGRVTGIPLVGTGLQAPFAQVASAGADLVAAGDRLDAAVGSVAWVVTLLATGMPVLLVVAGWVGLRLRRLRQARAVVADLGSPGSSELLALRALVRRDPGRLRRVAPDPVAGFLSGDPDVLRALAQLELEAVGLSRAAWPAPAPDRPATGPGPGAGPVGGR
jgi:hypothetical protein